jgi:hypothetical protein
MSHIRYVYLMLQTLNTPNCIQVGGDDAIQAKESLRRTMPIGPISNTDCIGTTPVMFCLTMFGLKTLLSNIVLSNNNLSTDIFV